MYKLEYEITIACAHHLQDTESLTTKKCLQPHGHSYKIRIEIFSKTLIDDMVVDFGKIKQVIEKYDHRDLNEFFKNPTTETFAYQIYSELREIISQECELSVKINESDKSSITYFL